MAEPFITTGKAAKARRRIAQLEREIKRVRLDKNMVGRLREKVLEQQDIIDSEEGRLTRKDKQDAERLKKIAAERRAQGDEAGARGAESWIPKPKGATGPVVSTGAGMGDGGAAGTGSPVISTGEGFGDGGAGPGGASMDVRAIQQRLVNAGYKIKVDGKWGPRSEKAWTDFTSKGGSMSSDARAASTPDGAGTGGGGGAATAPAAGVSPAPAAAPTAATPAAAPSSSLSPGDFRAKVLAEVPSAAAFLNIPELIPALQARIDGTISDQEFVAQVQNTNWWKTTPQKARAWMGLYALDPASAERQIDDDVAKVKAAAGDYYVPMADVTAREWAKKRLTGEVPDDAFAGYLKEQAKSMFPSLAGAIDRGVSVRTYAAPYTEIAAQLLEINPNEVNFMDPKWQRALMTIDKDGNRTSMSLADWSTTLRKDPAYGWDRTTQAREQASEFASQLRKTFGGS